MKIEIINDHVALLLGDGRRALVDTGAPLSWGPGSFHVLGHERRLGNGPIDVKALSAAVGGPLDAVVGNDILAEAPVWLDWEAGTLEQVAELAGTVVIADTQHRVPVVDVEVAGQVVRAVVDTGARACFVEVLPADADQRMDWSDFLPTPGTDAFTTPSGVTGVTIGGVSRRCRVVELPEFLRTGLKCLEIDAIVGMSFLKLQRTGFDLRTGRLVFDSVAGG